MTVICPYSCGCIDALNEICHSRHHTPTPGGTDHTPIMVPDIEGITADHNPTPIHTVTEAAALEGTPHTLLSTTAASTALQLMDTPITPNAVITTDTVAPHPTLTISPTGATDTTPWTEATLTPAAPATEHKILNPER